MLNRALQDALSLSLFLDDSSGEPAGRVRGGGFAGSVLARTGRAAQQDSSMMDEGLSMSMAEDSDVDMGSS